MKSLDLRDNIVAVAKSILPFNLYPLDYNRYNIFAETNTYWITPKYANPSYKYNKLFFKQHNSSVKIGLHMEKGITSEFSQEDKNIRMTKDWEWYINVNKIKSGELDLLIKDRYNKSKRPICIEIKDYIIIQKNKQTIDTYNFNSNGWQPNCKDGVSSIILKKINSDQDIDWKWVNIYVYQIFKNDEIDNLDSESKIQDFIRENLTYLNDWMNISNS